MPRGAARVIARRKFPTRVGLFGAVVAVGSIVALAPPAVAANRSTTSSLEDSVRCPWVSAAFNATHTPTQLAAMVIARMTLSEKLGMVDLHQWHGYENRTDPI